MMKDGRCAIRLGSLIGLGYAPGDMVEGRRWGIHGIGPRGGEGDSGAHRR